jgi:hypothetical protein
VHGLLRVAIHPGHGVTGVQLGAQPVELPLTIASQASWPIAPPPEPAYNPQQRPRERSARR